MWCHCLVDCDITLAFPAPYSELLGVNICPVYRGKSSNEFSVIYFTLEKKISHDIYLRVSDQYQLKVTITVIDIMYVSALWEYVHCHGSLGFMFSMQIHLTKYMDIFI